MGGGAWMWDLNFLSKIVNVLVSHTGSRKDPNKNSELVGCWLQSLDEKQKKHWQELKLSLSSLNNDNLSFSLALVSCRLALVICPNNMQAIKSLQSMQVDISIIRSLENFILSDSYTKIRKKNSQLSMVSLSELI